MEMWKLGRAGEADLTDDLAGRHGFAGPHRHAALRQMAILGLVRVRMCDDETVPAFGARDLRHPSLANRDVGGVGADAEYSAGSCRPNSSERSGRGDG